MKNGIAIDELGNRRYYLHGQLHRINGPAVEYIDGDKFWFIKGLYHREDGPACIRVSGYIEWALNGRRCESLNDWLMHHPTMTLAEKIIFKLAWVGK
jgi:hypothetical protein